MSYPRPPGPGGTMRPDRLTTTAQQALADAQSDALARSNPEVNGLHILGALLAEKTGPVTSIIGKAGGDAGRILTITQAELKRLPTTSSGAGSTGRAIMELLSRAEAESKRLGDTYISSEHLLVALAEVGGPAREILTVNGLDRKHLDRAIKQIREASGVQNVDTPEGESSYE